VNTQTNGESFVCMWVGCKVFDKTSCSRSWLERHVCTHGGSKPFKCIVEGCGQRFSTQVNNSDISKNEYLIILIYFQTILQRHVNSHFNQSGVSNSSASNGVRKSLESASNKLFKRNGKRLRLRRQPWSGKLIFVFFFCPIEVDS
jgi:zinc finger protein AEBP2